MASARAGLKAPVLLVVEDDAPLRRLLSLALERAGYTVETAPDGPEAVRLVGALRPDVVLMDIGLPGMDGVEAGRRIRDDETLSPIAIVTMTACATPEVCARVRAAGLLGPLPKPLDLLALAHQIPDWIATAAAAGP